MKQVLRHYLVITGGYWAFTLTDGAIRMLVILYFHLLGYSPLDVAMLFLFYEFFGIVTNLIGGWLAVRLGLNVTMHIGMALQILALFSLTIPDSYLSIVYVMIAQAISGIAKDLNKMSAKASVKTLLAHDTDSSLFKWVALLTGSKNTLKGLGFFLGALLLQLVGFRLGLTILAVGLLIVLVTTWTLLPNALGKAKSKAKFSQIFSQIPAINYLSAARFFLFGSRDIWFVVALPVFFYEVLHWDFMQIGGFMATWVILYGIVQAITPRLLQGRKATGKTAHQLAIVLSVIPAGIALALMQNWNPEWVVVIGLALFGFVFAINSALHSYLILAYSDQDKIAMNVGFYYMANAGGRLTGTLLSGLIYQYYGLSACLWFSAGFILLAALLSLRLPD